MTALALSSLTLDSCHISGFVDEAELPLPRSWPATTAGPWMPTATICAHTSSGPPTSESKCSTHHRQGSKPVAIPLVPRVATTIDHAIGERHAGPILRRADGQRLERRTAHR